MAHRQRKLLIVILGGLTAIGPFAIDIYLPAIPTIAQDLATSMPQVVLTLASYFVGVSLGQLFYGPLLDRYGRKKPMLAGLSIFLLAAIACAAAPSINLLIGARFAMAIGACVGLVGSRAVVRDIFPRSETARVFSILMLFLAVAPVLAPSVGGLLVGTLGWRWVFGVLFILGGLLLASVALFVPESKPADSTVSLHPLQVLRSYWIVAKNPVFLAYATASGMAQAVLFSYISGSPFVVMRLMGFSEQGFGLLFAANAAGMVAASQVNRRLLRTRSSSSISCWIAAGQAAVAAVLLAETLAFGLDNYFALGLIFIIMSLQGFITPNTTALALHPFTLNAGSASALLGSFQMAFGATAAGLMSLFHNDTAIPMLALLASFSLIGLLVMVKHMRTACVLPAR